MSEVYSAQNRPLATWNTVRGVWETDRGSLLCEHLEPFSEVWPTSGIMTSNGQVFELQTPVHRMDDSEFSSSPRRSIPTPTVSDYKWDGSHRLSAKFTEWMMGVPEGHITSDEIGLSRADALKACGNGVVPQQALLALQYLLREES